MSRVELRLKNRKGAILVLTAVGFIVLAIMLAVVIDMSRLYVQRNELQTGADAAAIAGALQMAEDSIRTVDTAVAYAQRNKVLNGTVTLAAADVQCGVWSEATGYSSSPASATCGRAANAVLVTRRDTLRHMFPGLLSSGNPPVVTRAIAWVAPTVSSTDCIKPFGIPDTVLFNLLDKYRTTPRSGNALDTTDTRILRTNSTDLTFCVKDGSQSAPKCPGSGNQPGNFNPVKLAPGDNGANDYGNNISNPCTAATPVIGVGDALAVETGNMVGQTKKGTGDWCDLFPNELCYVKIVLWHDEAPGATATTGATCQPKATGSGWCIRVSQVAAAVLTSYGNGGVIQGYFTLMNDPGGGIGTAPGALTRVILVR